MPQHHKTLTFVGADVIVASLKSVKSIRERHGIVELLEIIKECFKQEISATKFMGTLARKHCYTLRVRIEQTHARHR